MSCIKLLFLSQAFGPSSPVLFTNPAAHSLSVRLEMQRLGPSGLKARCSTLVLSPRSGMEYEPHKQQIPNSVSAVFLRGACAAGLLRRPLSEKLESFCSNMHLDESRVHRCKTTTSYIICMTSRPALVLIFWQVGRINFLFLHLVKCSRFWSECTSKFATTKIMRLQMYLVY